MSTVKRVAPKPGKIDPVEDWEILEWRGDCLTDLAAGKHAVGCGCWEHPSAIRKVGDLTLAWKPGACTEIVKCALEFRDYEVEAPDEVPR